jgi:membrane protein DedA with SNARE-associated domain
MLEYLVATYGYAVILIGTFFEGETVLVIGGYLAHLGYLKLHWVVASAFAGTFVGDQLFFFIGRKKGMAVLKRRKRWKRKAKKMVSLLHRHQNWVIIGFRFLYGMRTVTPFLIGASGISPLRFFWLNLAGALVWAVAVGFAGYLLGNTVELFIAEAHRYEFAVLGLIAAAGFGAWALRRFWHRRDDPPKEG